MNNQKLFQHRILKFLSDNIDYEYTIDELIQELGIPSTSLYSSLWNAYTVNLVTYVRSEGKLYWSAKQPIIIDNSTDKEKKRTSHIRYMVKIQRVLNAMLCEEQVIFHNKRRAYAITKDIFFEVCERVNVGTVKTKYHILRYLKGIGYLTEIKSKTNNVKMLVRNSHEVIDVYISKMHDVHKTIKS